MTWQIYRLTFRLETPLHIGRRGWGIIQRTRPYVMGKNLWAATTARLTRLLNSGDYRAVGEVLKRVAVFTYCYPATDVDHPLLPHYRLQDGLEKGLYYGDLDAVAFEYAFIGSYAATAIDPVAQAAEEASLHEVEVVLPHTRSDGRQVYLCGYLLLRDGATVLDTPITVDTLYALLDDVQVGGERGYGYGRLLLQRDRCGLENSRCLFDRYELTGTSDGLPEFTVPASQPLPAHALLVGLRAGGEI